MLYKMLAFSENISKLYNYLFVDPTQFTGRRDLLLNEKKMWVDFRVLENSSSRRNNFALEPPLTFCFYFIKGKTK